MKQTSLKVLSTGERFEYNSANLGGEFKIGERLLVETGQGEEVAVVSCVNPKKFEGGDARIERSSIPLRVIRRLSNDDESKLLELKQVARGYLGLCQQKIEKYKLVMTLIDADLSFDGKKLTFYFTATARVDFRELVADLIRSFQKIIRLQQIGPRDEARLLGGHGVCGRAICCGCFMTDFEPVTLDAIKNQNLHGVSSNKMTGACGKLMCCLNFEEGMYQEVSKSREKKITQKGS